MGTTAAGSALAISAGAPATLDEVGYAALTYAAIGGVEKIGTFGAAPAKSTFQPLKGPVRKHKGPGDFGALQPSLLADAGDAGQALLAAAAAEARALFSFRITLPDGGVRYFRGRVFGFQEAVEGAESMLTSATVIEINTPIVRVPGGSPVLPAFAVLLGGAPVLLGGAILTLGAS